MHRDYSKNKKCIYILKVDAQGIKELHVSDTQTPLGWKQSCVALTVSSPLHTKHKLFKNWNRSLNDDILTRASSSWVDFKEIWRKP